MPGLEGLQLPGVLLLHLLSPSGLFGLQMLALCPTFVWVPGFQIQVLMLVWLYIYIAQLVSSLDPSLKEQLD